MKVLVTGAGALLGQGILRALQRSSLKTHIAAADPSEFAAGLYWADEAHRLPMARDPSFLEEFRQVLTRVRPDAVLVGTDVELPILAEHRRELERDFGTVVVVSRPEVIELANDKLETAEKLAEKGFATPRSSLPESAADLVAEVGFPLVVKPRDGARSIGLSYVRDEGELRVALDACENAVVQECVGSSDSEYTAGVLVLGGEVTGSIVMHRMLRDGNTHRASVEPRSFMNEEVERLGRALQPLGPLNVQFRLHQGRVTIFELNARFSGTTPLRCLAGFREVEWTLRSLVLGEKIEAPEPERKLFLRHLSETVVDPEKLAW